jgi:hypothetical protein
VEKGEGKNPFSSITLTSGFETEGKEIKSQREIQYRKDLD